MVRHSIGFPAGAPGHHPELIHGVPTGLNVPAGSASVASQGLRFRLRAAAGRPWPAGEGLGSEAALRRLSLIIPVSLLSPADCPSSPVTASSGAQETG